MKALAEESAKKKADERAREEAELARAVEYPLLSNVVDHNEDISLNNPKVKECSASALTEVIQLHTVHEVDLSKGKFHLLNRREHRRDCLLKDPKQLKDN